MTARHNVDWDAAIAFETFQDLFPVPRSVRGDVRTLAHLRETRLLPPKSYPMLVAFRDIADPKSVYELQPDDLSPALGPGARVISMTIEMTGDRVTYAIDKRLPWVAGTGGNLKGEKFTTSNEFAATLGAPAFRKRGS